MQAFLSISSSAHLCHQAPISEINTSLHNINPNILHNSLNLLLHKRRRSLMNPIDTRRVLRSQSRRRSHGIAAMRRNDFLIGFEAPARCCPSARCVLQSPASGSPLPHQSKVKLTPHQSCPSQLSRECASLLRRFRGYCDCDGDS